VAGLSCFPFLAAFFDTTLAGSESSLLSSIFSVGLASSSLSSSLLDSSFLDFLAGLALAGVSSFLLAGELKLNFLTNSARPGDPGGTALAFVTFLNFSASLSPTLPPRDTR